MDEEPRMNKRVNKNKNMILVVNDSPRQSDLASIILHKNQSIGTPKQEYAGKDAKTGQ